MSQDLPYRTLGFLLHDAARLLRKRFEQKARAHGSNLTRAQWSVLAHLSRQEGVNQTTLADTLDVEPITVARLVDKLEQLGLIERRADPGDRRARLLYLQPAAAPLLAEMRGGHGRASGWGRGCQYEWVSGVAVSIKKKK